LTVEDPGFTAGRLATLGGLRMACHDRRPLPHPSHIHTVGSRTHRLAERGFVQRVHSRTGLPDRHPVPVPVSRVLAAVSV
jgi:hypothetical protein